MRTRKSMTGLLMGAVLALGGLWTAPAAAAPVEHAPRIAELANAAPSAEQVGFKTHGHRKHFRKRHGSKFLFRFGKRHIQRNNARRGHFHKGYGHHHHRHGHRAHSHRFGHGHGHKNRVHIDPTFQFIFR